MCDKLEECSEARKYRLALESLTPLGSEFYKNPELCVKYVNDIRMQQHRQIVKLVKENRELRLQCKQR